MENEPYQSPPIYKQLGINIKVNQEAFEIRMLHRLLSAHLGKVRSGNITDAGRQILNEIRIELNSVEQLLEKDQ